MPCAGDWRTSGCPHCFAGSLRLAAEGSAASLGLYLGKTPEEEALAGNRHLGAHCIEG